MDHPLFIGVGIGFGLAVGNQITQWALISLGNVINGFVESARYKRLGASDQMILEHAPRIDKRVGFACRSNCPICTDLGLIDLSKGSQLPMYPPGYEPPNDV
jgi:hypothetical protein